MTKSNLLKSGLLLAVMVILMMAATMTAYAVSNGAEDDNGGVPAADQQTAGATVVVYQLGDNDSLAEIINGIIEGTQGIPLEQGNINIIIVVPTQDSNGVADAIATVTSMDATPTAPALNLPVQSAPPTQQSVLPTASQTTTELPSITTQPQNKVEIITRAEQSGNPLQDASFTVYRVDGNQRVGEAITDADGKASISLAQGEYYMRNDSVQYGYLRERSRIFFTVGTNGDVTVEVTIERDASIPDVDVGDIAVPKTGEIPPVMNYMLGTVFLALALFCGIGLLRQRKRTSYKRKGALAYA